MNFGTMVKMQDGRIGVIVGYSSALGAYNIAVQGDNDESYYILEWRNDFIYVDDDVRQMIVQEKNNLTERIAGFNSRIENERDSILNSCYVGWRDATELSLRFMYDLENKVGFKL